MRMTCRRFTAGLAIMMGLVGVARPARADPECRLDHASSAREFFERGRALSKEGSYEEALACYERSEALAPSLSVALNRATCELALGRWLTAARRLLRALPALANDPRRRDLAREALAQSLVHLAVVRLSFPVEGAHPGVKPTITIDGQPWVDEHDGGMLVEPGDHQVEEMSNRSSRRRVLRVSAGEKLVWTVNQGPVRPAPGAPLPSVADRRIHWSTWTLSATGIAGVLASVVTGAIALTIDEELRRTCPGRDRCDGGTEDRAALGRALSQASTLAGVFGVSGASGAVLTFRFLGPPQASAGPAPVTAGFSFGGIF